MYMYRQRHCRPGFSLLSDLKKQYRNNAILKPITFEPLLATPVIRAQHAGDLKSIRDLTFPEDSVIREAYKNAKRYNPHYSYKTLEQFADIQSELEEKEKLDKHEAYELALYELGRKNRVSDVMQRFTLADAERHFGLRVRTQSTFFSTVAMESDLASLRQRLLEIAHMRLNGVREDELTKRLLDLNITTDMVNCLLRKYPDLQSMFEDEITTHLYEPEKDIVDDIISLSRLTEKGPEKVSIPLSKFRDRGEAELEETIAEENKEAEKVASQERLKTEKLTPKGEEQRRLEYKKMRALKRQRK